MFYNRNIVLMAVCVVLLALILVRLTQVQLIWGREFEHDYRAGAPHRGEILESIRGTILTADGKELAKDVVSYDLAVHYSALESETWIEDAAILTGKSPETLKKRADNIKSRVQRIWDIVSASTRMENLRIVEQEQFHPLVRNIPREKALKINAAGDILNGIQVQEKARRQYAGGDLFAHIIGHCSRLNSDQWAGLFEQELTWSPGMPVEDIGARYRMDDTTGVSGLERSYENELRGTRGYVTERIEFHPFSVERVSETRPPEPGKDLHLTLRTDMQRAVMDVFRRAADDPDRGFRSGSAVILDINSGAVLAAGTWPSYSYEEIRNDYESILQRSHSPLFFRPAQAAFPTGSVYKLITSMAALEEGILHRGTALQCEGRKEIHGHWFGCQGYHGNISLEEALEKSCNVYFYKAALGLSGRQLSEWGERFGLGSATELDWPAESSGRMNTPASVLGRVNLSIGQGDFTATPLQIAAMTAAIANGGKLVTPHFVSQVHNPVNSEKSTMTPETQEVPVSRSTLEAVRAGMQRAVHGRGGTARESGLRDFMAAGKTGTAELGAGLPNHAWFTGYAPFDDPKIAFALVSERTEGQGGTHAAPLMAEILEQVGNSLILFQDGD